MSFQCVPSRSSDQSEALQLRAHPHNFKLKGSDLAWNAGSVADIEVSGVTACLVGARPCRQLVCLEHLVGVRSSLFKMTRHDDVGGLRALGESRSGSPV